MEFITQPQVFHVAATSVNMEQVQSYLSAIGAEGWKTDEGVSGSEFLTELLGRMCYQSFGLELNKNLTKVREGNREYVSNILRSKHGAVIEHGYDTYIFLGVSRVLTHEQVRHRIADYSQESLRFVRLTDLKMYWPDVFANHVQSDELGAIFRETTEYLEGVQHRLTEVLGMDDPNMPFATKKELQSAMRRLAPIGLCTSIAVTANHRSWRHIIEMRTSRHAEEEIRKAMAEVFYTQAHCYPALYQDAKVNLWKGLPEVTFENQKV